MRTLEIPEQGRLFRPQTPSEYQAVRKQLSRLIADPLFSHSKRYPAFLTYVVEQALSGKADEIKERVIGVEVYNCDPNYDTAISTTVRVIALEVRKRLVQYYSEAGHEGEIRIALTTGSYVPLFFAPGSVGEADLSKDENAAAQREPSRAGDTTAPIRHPADESPVESPLFSAARSGFAAKRRNWYWIAAVCIAAVIAVALYHTQPASTAEVTRFHQFWNQLAEASGSVQLCFGTWNEDSPSGPGTAVDFHAVRSMTRVATLLEERGKPYLGTSRLLAAGDVASGQFRDGPVIYIGSYSPVKDLIAEGRYHFVPEENSNTVWVHDRHDSSLKQWRTEGNLSSDQRSESYAIVSRLIDRRLNRPMVVVAGLARPSISAAARVLLEPEHMNAFLADAPENWQNLNLQAVVETQIVSGQPQPPRIVATHFWD